MNKQATFWRGVSISVLLALPALGCRPGYLRASDLESSGQGPAACAKSCEDMGMRMGALVLVSNSLPGCVCQPVVTQAPTPKLEAAPPATPAAPVVAPPAPASAPPSGDAPAPSAPTSDASQDGAAAATAGFAVLAGAAVVQQAEQEHERQAQAIKY